ncbi:hypothetical protein AQJ43_12430 [Streptomyces avermitilis]|uniref:Uncharacterized protein n=2 Tax=Streptomyces avermitilis TaxID=33903 RepID=Q829T6_STRAW|nr:hypothetical protein AQJ43_12430 [Streptomyces avermitilis]BAC74034.1 hypothetical protein SAVERM_6323 [Streptomyces avermitilis MA-4680 = NBRC 14893]OOV11457.1 hypothetical protein SM007_40145 [Streptomyces avermitilis]BBJ54555.1 hypothetical protein SAVMC3_71840 [Streptomyces avermitilis]GDY66558.1 hypothetical protein SAV14893_059510 [Streptomyces avermitilis]
MSAPPPTGPLVTRNTVATQLDGHAPDCRLGERSPSAGLAKLGARVLLLGAGYDTCASFHLAGP